MVDSGEILLTRRISQCVQTVFLDWLKIKLSLIPRLQAQRSVIIRSAVLRRLFILEKIYPKYCSLYSEGVQKTILPGLGDIITSPGPIRRILETTTLPRFNSQWTNVHIGDFGSVKVEEVETIWLIWRTLSSSEFSEFTKKWREQKEQELLQIFRDSTAHLSDSPSVQLHDLQLATTVFKCNAYTCGKNLYYDEALQHSCTTKYDFQEWAQASPTSIMFSRFMSKGTSVDPCIIDLQGISIDCCKTLKVEPWNHGGNRISFNNRASEVARRVLDQDQYLSSSTTTIHEIRSYNPRICCKTCFRTSFPTDSYWSDLVSAVSVSGLLKTKILIPGAIVST